MNVARPRRRPAGARGNVSPRLTFRPHAGAQVKWFTTQADFKIGGGGAGGGKTRVLLMDGLIDIDDPAYEFALFRKTLVMHRMGGGLRRESKKYYPQAGGMFNDSELLWRFPAGSEGKFYGCDDPAKYDGLQCRKLLIDQLEQLTAEEFWHLQSRVRDSSGRRTSICATVNPEPGWLEVFLKSGGYVGRDGLSVPEMDGVVTYFVRKPDTDELAWRSRAGDFGELDEDGMILDGEYEGLLPTSFTYIRFPLDENPSIPKSYRAKLQNMMIVERRKKLDGNWNQFSGGGSVYRASWWGLNGDVWTPDHPNVLSMPPKDEELHSCLATDVGWSALGDWSCIFLIGQGRSAWYLLDMVKFRAREHVTFEAIRRCGEVAGKRECAIVLPRDPGKAGLDQEGWQLELGRLGFRAVLLPDDGKGGDKVARHRFLSPQAETGHLKVVRDWRPLREVSFWLSQQESAPGKMVEVTTVDEWAREAVNCMHALGPDCAHEATDVTDALARGHRFLTVEDPVGASRMAAQITDPATWHDERGAVARTVVSEWARVRPGSSSQGAADPNDFMYRSGRAHRVRPRG